MSNCRDRRGRFTSCDIGERQRRHSRRRGMGASRGSRAFDPESGEGPPDEFGYSVQKMKGGFGRTLKSKRDVKVHAKRLSEYGFDVWEWEDDGLYTVYVLTDNNVYEEVISGILGYPPGRYSIRFNSDYFDR
jgi:hypothetical protein